MFLLWENLHCRQYIPDSSNIQIDCFENSSVLVMMMIKNFHALFDLLESSQLCLPNIFHWFHFFSCFPL